MMPSRSDTADTLPTLSDEPGAVNDNRSNHAVAVPRRFDRQWSNPIMTALSPPHSVQPIQPVQPVPPVQSAQPVQLVRTVQPQPKRKKSHARLRSDSGLALHPNQAVFRQYADYKSDGSLQIRPYRSRAMSYDATSSVEDFVLEEEATIEEPKGFVFKDRVLPNFFEPSVIELAFSDPATGQRLRKFAETRQSTPDIDFLLKVSAPVSASLPRYGSHADGLCHRWKSIPVRSGMSLLR